MNKNSFILMLLPLFWGCSNNSDGEGTPKQYTLTTGVIIEEWGIVTPSGGTYNEGTELILRAIPNPGYKFIDWGGGFIQSMENPVTVKMDRDKYIIAFINTPLYLDDNGITVKSYECGEVGDMVTLNGNICTILDETLLREMVENGEDVTRVCTSYVSDMSELFYGSSFNQDISSWDASNVVNMRAMFYESQFNQDISSWNVPDMSSMFSRSSFNQDIGSWDVRSVTDMFGMLQSTPFNQNLSNWNVDNVTSCNSFSADTPQSILPKPNFTNCNPN